jgi:hypothetical protein
MHGERIKTVLLDLQSELKHFSDVQMICYGKPPIRKNIVILLSSKSEKKSVPGAARSKVWVCGRSPAEIVGSNPAGDMVVCRL